MQHFKELERWVRTHRLPSSNPVKEQRRHKRTNRKRQVDTPTTHKRHIPRQPDILLQNRSNIENHHINTSPLIELQSRQRKHNPLPRPDPILLERLHPLEISLLFKLERIDNSLLLGLDFFIFGLSVVYVAHDADGFVHAASLDEVSGCFGEAEEDDGDDHGRENLHGDGEAPGDGSAYEIHAEGEEVGDCDSEGCEEDLTLLGLPISKDTYVLETYFGGYKSASNIGLAKLCLARELSAFLGQR